MVIDHIDGNIGNNKIDNLRCITKADNCKNKKVYSTSQTGANGVIYCGKTRKYIVRISAAGKTLTVGRFQSKSAALKARLGSENRFFGEFARTCD